MAFPLNWIERFFNNFFFKFFINKWRTIPVDKGKPLTVDFSRVTIRWSHRDTSVSKVARTGSQYRKTHGEIRRSHAMRDLCERVISRYAFSRRTIICYSSKRSFISADVCRSSREADGTSIKRKNRGNSRKAKDGGRGRAKGRTLMRAYRRDLTRDPERSSRGGKRVAYPRRSPRDADWWSWRAVRKKGGYGRGGGGYPSR